MILETSEEITEISAALVEFQGKVPTIEKSREVTVTSRRTGTEYKFKYAPLDAILEKIRQPLHEAGLAVTQPVTNGQGGAAIQTLLLHKTGQWMSVTFTIPYSGGPQEFGSAITYGRRYGLSALLGLAAEDDDDANRASGNDVNNVPPNNASVIKAVDLENMALDSVTLEAFCRLVFLLPGVAAEFASPHRIVDWYKYVVTDEFDPTINREVLNWLKDYLRARSKGATKKRAAQLVSENAAKVLQTAGDEDDKNGDAGDQDDVGDEPSAPVDDDALDVVDENAVQDAVDAVTVADDDGDDE